MSKDWSQEGRNRTISDKNCVVGLTRKFFRLTRKVRTSFERKGVKRVSFQEILPAIPGRTILCGREIREMKRGTSKRKSVLTEE